MNPLANEWIKEVDLITPIGHSWEPMRCKLFLEFLNKI